MVVQTDIVSNSKTGTLGHVGSCLQVMSGVTPMFGFTMQISGTILSMIDAQQQQVIVKRLFDFFHNEQELEKFVVALCENVLFPKNVPDNVTTNAANAAKPLLFDLDLWKLDSPQTLFDLIQEQWSMSLQHSMTSIKQALHKARSYLSLSHKSKNTPNLADIKTLATLSQVQTFLSIGDDPSSLITNHPDELIEKGGQHGSVIAGYIISLIYSNTHSMSKYDKVSEIHSIIREKFSFSRPFIEVLRMTNFLEDINEQVHVMMNTSDWYVEQEEYVYRRDCFFQECVRLFDINQKGEETGNNVRKGASLLGVIRSGKGQLSSSNRNLAITLLELLSQDDLLALSGFSNSSCSKTLAKALVEQLQSSQKVFKVKVINPATSPSLGLSHSLKLLTIEKSHTLEKIRDGLLCVLTSIL